MTPASPGPAQTLTFPAPAALINANDRPKHWAQGAALVMLAQDPGENGSWPWQRHRLARLLAAYGSDAASAVRHLALHVPAMLLLDHEHVREDFGSYFPLDQGTGEHVSAGDKELRAAIAGYATALGQMCGIGSWELSQIALLEAVATWDGLSEKERKRGKKSDFTADPHTIVSRYQLLLQGIAQGLGEHMSRPSWLSRLLDLAVEFEGASRYYLAQAAANVLLETVQSREERVAAVKGLFTSKGSVISDRGYDYVKAHPEIFPDVAADVEALLKSGNGCEQLHASLELGELTSKLTGSSQQRAAELALLASTATDFPPNDNLVDILLAAVA